MERIIAAYRAGVAEAERDIASGRPKLHYGARGAWGADWARTLKARFGVELVPLDCFIDATRSSFRSGYNDTVEAHVGATHGPEALEAVSAEIQRRRLEAYHSWETEAQRAESGAPPTHGVRHA